jgi:hypothetical protein
LLPLWLFGRTFLRERIPRGGCLVGSGRWQTPSDPRQLFAGTDHRQYDRVGIAESVASTALIHLQNIGELWLIDFGSSNGTFLNKRRIHHPVRLDEHKTIVTQRTLRQIENIACWLLVADTRNFTPLTQSMRTEGLETLLGNWLSARKNMIEKHGGEINKYLEMVFWPIGGRLRPLSKTSPPSSPT